MPCRQYTASAVAMLGNPFALAEATVAPCLEMRTKIDPLSPDESI
jgi:hypothetical protein